MFGDRTRCRAALIALIALIACGKNDPEHDSETSPPATGLENITSAVEASQAIKRIEIKNCESVRQSLVALQRRTWDDLALRGLVSEILHRGKSLCSEAEFGTWKPGVATSLARSLVATDAFAAVEALANAPRAAVILRRRAELRFEMGEDKKGLDLLIDSLALEEDEEVRSRSARLSRMQGDLEQSLQLCGDGSGTLLAAERVSTLAALGRGDAVSLEIARAELHTRPELSKAAVASAVSPRDLGKSIEAGADLLLAVAMADGISTEDSVAFLKRATTIAPTRVELFVALAEVEERSGNIRESVSAWDRAAGLAPGLERAILVPIRLMKEAGRENEAIARAHAVAEDARGKKNADALQLASQAYRYAGESKAAVRLAREALARSPGEGRFASELAYRLEEAGEVGEASSVLARLLVCGSRDKPWHRHEIVARLRKLGGEEEAIAAVPCDVVDPAGLASSLR